MIERLWELSLVVGFIIFLSVDFLEFDRVTQTQSVRGFDHWGAAKRGLQLGEIETASMQPTGFRWRVMAR